MDKGTKSSEETLQELILSGRHYLAGLNDQRSEGLEEFREHNYIKNDARHEL